MATPTDADINRVIEGYNRADGAADYAGTIVCQMQPEYGENFSMVWSNYYSGQFVPNKTNEEG